MYEYSACMFVCASHACSTLRGQKKALDPMGPEFQAVSPDEIAEN